MRKRSIYYLFKKGVKNMTKENFIMMMYNEINRFDKPEHLKMLCLCQSCLETGFGRSSLMIKNNAPFGIKATGNKAYYEAKTNEYVDEHYVTTTAKFCRYNSLHEAIADYFKLLDALRYERVRNSMSFKEAAHMIRLCGYATSPGYTDTLLRVYDEVSKIIVADECAYNAFVNTQNDPLNVREYPNTNSKVLTTLPKGTKIKIETEWSYIPELKGFVSNKYIERIEENA